MSIDSFDLGELAALYGRCLLRAYPEYKNVGYRMVGSNYVEVCLYTAQNLAGFCQSLGFLGIVEKLKDLLSPIEREIYDL